MVIYYPFYVCHVANLRYRVWGRTGHVSESSDNKRKMASIGELYQEGKWGYDWYFSKTKH